MPTNPDWNGLRAGLDGEVVRPGTAAYHCVRRPALARFGASRPDAVVLATTDADAAEAVRFARQCGQRIRRRSGGHCFAGRSSGAGMVLDVTALRSVNVVDATVVVGAGARPGDLDDALGSRTLTLPTGSPAGLAVVGAHRARPHHRRTPADCNRPERATTAGRGAGRRHPLRPSTCRRCRATGRTHRPRGNCPSRAVPPCAALSRSQATARQFHRRRSAPGGDRVQQVRVLPPPLTWSRRGMSAGPPHPCLRARPDPAAEFHPPWGGAYNRVSSDRTAFARRDELFLLEHVVRVGANVTTKAQLQLGPGCAAPGPRCTPSPPGGSTPTSLTPN